jgi:hypothetical protein
LEHGADERYTRLPPATGLRQKLVNVSRDCFIKVVFFPIQPAGHRMRMPIGEEAVPAEVPQVFLQSAQRPRAVWTQLENVPTDLSRLVTYAARLREEVWVK